MRAFLIWLTGFLPCRIINDGERPYLERYYLATLFGTRWYIHRFVASDPDRGLHDHPWKWAVSVILSGSYLEERRGIDTHPMADFMQSFLGKPKNLIRRNVRWFNFLTGDTFHRVILGANMEVWTLFGHQKARTKEWGFMRPTPGNESVYFPHTAKSDDWWKRSPKGREVRAIQPKFSECEVRGIEINERYMVRKGGAE